MTTGPVNFVAHFGTPHFKTLSASADWLVAEHGPHGKPLTAELLAMITELSPTGV